MSGLVWFLRHLGPAFQADLDYEADLAARTSYGPGMRVTVQMRPEEMAKPSPNAWREYMAYEVRRAARFGTPVLDKALAELRGAK